MQKLENHNSLGEKQSPLVEFYKDKTLFVTGGTGFVGTALIEKLLYACGGLKCIYLLTKSSYGTNIEDKIEKWWNSEAFDRLRDKTPEAISKIIPIGGDLREKKLGLQDKDIKRLQKEVNIVFHVAADVRFDMPLKEAVNVNTKATEEIIRIGKGIEHLKAFVYVSTAYSNSNRKVIGEKVYSTDIPLKAIYEALENCDKSQLFDHFLEGRPNTYAYSKALSEELFAKEVKVMPITIVRPSVISSALREPAPGWLKSCGGAGLLTILLGYNVQRCWSGSNKCVTDFVPVDTTVNVLLAAAWDTAKEWKRDIEEVKVFNCCSGVRNPLSFGEIVGTCKRYFTRTSMFPFCFPPLVIQNRVLFTILHFILQSIPDKIFSLLNWITRGKIGFIKKLILSDRIEVLKKHLEFFSNNDFIFIDYNVKELYNKMDDQDKEIFDFDITKVEWKKYLLLYAEGLEKFGFGKSKK